MAISEARLGDRRGSNLPRGGADSNHSHWQESCVASQQHHQQHGTTTIQPRHQEGH